VNSHFKDGGQAYINQDQMSAGEVTLQLAITNSLPTGRQGCRARFIK